MHHLHHVSPSASAKQTQGHQKYIGNHYASCLALFYKFANYHLCHSPFPPWSPLSLSPLPLLLSPPSITTRGKVNFPSAFLFFSFFPPPPWWFPVERPDCGNASKDANLFLTSGVKIIKEYLNTQEGEARTGMGGGLVYTKLTPLCESCSCGSSNNSFRSKIG